MSSGGGINTKLSGSRDEGYDVVCGFHAVNSTLRRAGGVIRIWIDQSRNDPRAQSLGSLASEHHVPVFRTDRDELDRLAAGVRHQGVVAEIRLSPPKGEKELERLLDGLEHPPLLLILDQVQDPHNLGACLRTADGAGVDAVVLPKDGAAPVTDVVRRVAAGAAERLSIFYVTNLARVLDRIQKRGIWITGAADDASQSIYLTDFGGPSAIVLGSEGDGMRRLTRERCDQLVRIPMAGAVSSLNVSVAAGVLLFEVVRQRLAGNPSGG